MKYLLLSSLLLVFLCGCQPQYKQEFITVVDDHNLITRETTTAVIKSIDEALAENPPEPERQQLIDLRIRLVYMASSADVMRKYVYTTQVDDALLQELIKNSWNTR